MGRFGLFPCPVTIWLRQSSACRTAGIVNPAAQHIEEVVCLLGQV